MMKLIFDVDGTLMDIEHRRHFVTEGQNDWNSFMNPEVMKGDIPNKEVVSIALAMQQIGHEIVVVSARNERHREVTESQLTEAGIKFSHLFLRADDDYRSDVEFKRDVLNALRNEGWIPNLVFDDRNSVVEMWREEGIPCFQVAEGDF
jgi:phosphoglycolate phosphatase-like HAD superfamily hydrolase